MFIIELFSEEFSVQTEPLSCPHVYDNAERDIKNKCTTCRLVGQWKNFAFVCFYYILSIFFNSLISLEINVTVN